MEATAKTEILAEVQNDRPTEGLDKGPEQVQLNVTKPEETKPDWTKVQNGWGMTTIFAEIKKAQDQLAKLEALEQTNRRLEEANRRLEEANQEAKNKFEEVLSTESVYHEEREKFFIRMIAKFPSCEIPCYSDFSICRCTKTGRCCIVFRVQKSENEQLMNIFSRLTVGISSDSIKQLENKNFTITDIELSNVVFMPNMHVEIGRKGESCWSFIVVDDCNPNIFYGVLGAGFDVSYYPFDFTKETRQRV